MIFVEWADGPNGRGRVVGYSPDYNGQICAIVIVDGIRKLEAVPLVELTLVEDTSKGTRRILKREKRAARKAEKIAAAKEIHDAINGSKGA